MRWVDRPVGSEPAHLRDPSAKVRKERVLAAWRFRRWPEKKPGVKPFKFAAYRDFAVANALRVMFGGRCAYCETGLQAASASQIEHFRPKGGVQDEPDHSGYWWLATTWENLLPSCPGCNERRSHHIIEEMITFEEFEATRNRPPTSTHGKKNYFPVAGPRAMRRGDDLAGEDPLLIDPTVRDPSHHLRWLLNGPLSLVAPSVGEDGPDQYGATSIKGYALNRAGLVGERTGVLRELRFQREKIMTALEGNIAGAVSPQALQAARERAAELRRYHEPGKDFTALAKAFIDALEEELARMGAASAALE